MTKKTMIANENYMYRNFKIWEEVNTCVESRNIYLQIEMREVLANDAFNKIAGKVWNYQGIEQDERHYYYYQFALNSSMLSRASTAEEIELLIDSAKLRIELINAAADEADEKIEYEEGEFYDRQYEIECYPEVREIRIQAKENDTSNFVADITPDEFEYIDWECGTHYFQAELNVPHDKIVNLVEYLINALENGNVKADKGPVDSEETAATIHEIAHLVRYMADKGQFAALEHMLKAMRALNPKIEVELVHTINVKYDGDIIASYGETNEDYWDN